MLVNTVGVTAVFILAFHRCIHGDPSLCTSCTIHDVPSSLSLSRVCVCPKCHCHPCPFPQPLLFQKIICNRTIPWIFQSVLGSHFHFSVRKIAVLTRREQMKRAQIRWIDRAFRTQAFQEDVLFVFISSNNVANFVLFLMF